MCSRVVRSGLIAGLLIALTGALGGGASAEVGSRSPVLLPTLDGGSAFIHAINEHGLIVGSSETSSGAYHAVMWLDGAIVDLGTLGGRSSQATGVDDTGRIVGSSQDAEGRGHAVMWIDGQIHDLGIRARSSDSASAVSSAGIVGVYLNRDSFRARRAFFWDDADVRRPRVPNGSSAESVNDGGLVAGTFRWRDPSDPTFGTHRAFTWDADSDEVVRLGTLGGPDSTSNDINKHGHVVGQASTRRDAIKSFFWDGTEMHKLRDRGIEDPAARAINDAGVVVGTDGDTPGKGALIWPSPSERPRRLPVPAEAIGSSASDITESGIVVGTIDVIERGEFLIKPVVWH